MMVDKATINEIKVQINIDVFVTIKSPIEEVKIICDFSNNKVYEVNTKLCKILNYESLIKFPYIIEEQGFQLAYLSIICSQEMQKLFDNKHDMVIPINNYISLIQSINILLLGKNEILHSQILKQFNDINKHYNNYFMSPLIKNNFEKVIWLFGLVSLENNDTDICMLKTILNLLKTFTDQETYIKYKELESLSKEIYD